MVSRTDPWSAHRWVKRVGVASVVFLFLMIALHVYGLIDMRSRGLLFPFFWMIFVVIMMTVTHELKCPRCGQRFYAKGAEFSQTTGRCLHCGQEKYADVTPAHYAPTRPKRNRFAHHSDIIEAKFRSAVFNKSTPASRSI